MENYNFKYIWGITLVSAMGGLLFGYDWVVIGGAKPFYERFFDIVNSPYLQGWAMSSALLGCIVGAMGAGWLSDRFGRKPSLIVAAFLFTLSALGTGWTSDFTLFIWFRLLGGLGIGLASSISPIYIAEVAPAEKRGRFVSLNQLTIVIGILAAQIANYLIAEPVPEGATDTVILNSWNGQMGWRFMFWAELVPASLFFGLMFFVPESPRWLTKNHKNEAALKVLSKVGGLDYGQRVIDSIKHSLKGNSQKVRLKDLLAVKVRPILLIGIVLAVFQQWSGINVVFNYAEEIFRAAGFGVTDVLFNIVITGIVNLVFTFLALKTVDSWGRRKLMLFGSAGLAVTYLLLGGSYFFELNGFVVLLFVVLGIGIYAMSLAPITWVVLSEIFPNKIRGTAMSVGTSSLWIASFVLTYTFPLLNSSLGASGTFWVYALICLLGFSFILKKLPETKGKTLEEIEEYFEGENN
ncbi:sugar porter family MFS transporter [Marinilabilia rubra]|uniref:MFS transporter n=1 Tax=Marinilabilia rubra TaxID=2162893 RepID=A0A2U2B5Y9_9BACT|nr:sugar porter family MFS transporter [Marinilabilia rubra]PWD98466.1 MFS transporter [Marinilabilia rubra]